MRLNGWKRIGIVASVVWFVVVGLIAVSEPDNATRLHRLCINVKATPDPGKHLDMCYEIFKNNLPSAMQEKWIGALVSALVPIPIGWLFTYMVIWVVRWIRRGFKPA